MRWLALLVTLVARPGIGADPPGSPSSHDALARCATARQAAPAARSAAFADALARADVAIADDDHDALAHFAAFCALGGRLREARVGLSTVGDLRRLRREVDRTLDLAPDFVGALSGKGVLLLRLPRWLGGDAAEGERLLRRALALDPDRLTPRLALVGALRARGAVEESRREAEQALAIAERRGEREHADTARAHLRSLGAVAAPVP